MSALNLKQGDSSRIPSSVDMGGQYWIGRKKTLSGKGQRRGRVTQTDGVGESGTRGNNEHELFIIAGTITLPYSASFTSPIDPVEREDLFFCFVVCCCCGFRKSRDEKREQVP